MATRTRTTAVPSEPSANGSNGDLTGGRAPNGQFTGGNTYGPGNPFGRACAARRRALLAAVSEEDVHAVARKLLEMALNGDVPAAKLLLAHVVGKPVAAGNPDRLDLEEFLLARAWPNRAEALHVLLNSVPPGDVIEMLPRVLAGYTSAIERVYRGQKPDRTLATDTVKIAAADLDAKGGRGA